MIDLIPTGDVWFVCSTRPLAEDAISAGKTPERPFATLEFAMQRVADDNGDIVFVMPGHAETVTDITTTKSRLSIIGMGDGVAKPQFTLASSGFVWFNGGTGVLLENCDFIAGAGTSQAIFLDSTESTVRKCRFLTAVVAWWTGSL